MTEQDFGDWYQLWPDRATRRPSKFRDREDWERVRQLRPWQRTRLPRLENISRDSADTDDEMVTWLKEAGIRSFLLSRGAIKSLEANFERRVRDYGLGRADLLRVLEERALVTSGDRRLINLMTHIRGEIFEDLVTREFVRKEPSYFLASRPLTRSVLGPVSSVMDRGSSMPDHLVILKAQNDLLVGFMEDKKFIGERGRGEVFEQLGRQRNLWEKIAQSRDLQGKLRESMVKSLNFINRPIQFSDWQKGTIWLTVARDVSLADWQLPGWVRVFRSAVDNQAINDFAASLVYRRFLPKLLRANAS